MTVRAAIFGCAGPELSNAEIAFFRDVRPWGFILFARNIVDPDQLRALNASLRDSVGRADAPIFIDQEGGRVARMKPPFWRAAPPAARFGDLSLIDSEKGARACYLNARLLAAELHAAGINANCAPLIDIAVPSAHAIIGDRAFAGSAALVAGLGAMMCRGLLEGGVLPVIKHIPGHGRAGADSHLSLPVVDADLALLAQTDFVPFQKLAHMPLAMTAHIAYTAIDPDRPATQSPRLIGDVIRDTIGFDGVLMSDDLGMAALTGDFTARARDSIAAGCDIVLHCSGDLDEMRAVARGTPELAGAAARRCDRALAQLRPPMAFDEAAARDALHALLDMLEAG
ncbi:MAG TPA: beta-N-acetylhexosaminidase [Alphaproteobacteria bacterium]|nr:beta-N-acetylhexosaminidase [Alphaproteobacteria bacterium]HBC54207.1 beta-N-acetylhexosaminidase [Alphaproteobacteria bacterium]